MARTYKMVEIPAKRDKQCGSLTCDFCGKKSPNPRASYLGATEWVNDLYDKAEVCISCTMGAVYPDGSDCTMTSVDMCPDCFKSKFLLWVESQGVKPVVTDMGY